MCSIRVCRGTRSNKKKEIGHRNLTPSVGTAQSVLSHLPLKDRKKKGSRVRTRAGERVSSLFLLFSLRSFHSHSSLSLPSLSPSHSQLPSVSSSCLVSTGKHTSQLTRGPPPRFFFSSLSQVPLLLLATGSHRETHNGMYNNGLGIKIALYLGSIVKGTNSLLS